ncbi:transcriptional regulator [Haladaptatus sp. R4]|uniref:helix-turn-helix domain-containing protein n=1 Tax=Haladaptatus sp. R4 TaxID=1679489 RepID=UPI0007B4D9CF|nr:helix-turn-helix domain-containing protein [Haladaptatus sp. R4]KZN22612.1 transcriptional regulator [Haladaptatus sp. R4]
MKTEDDELAEGTVLPDERVARFEQLLDEKSELELTETMATVCGVHIAAFRVYLTVLDHPHSTIAEIAEILDRDQSTIGKQLQPLYEQELITRYPRTVSSGGVKYLHVAQPLAETAEWLQQELDRWTDAVMAQLSRLGAN